jgi:hypothetical protein
MRCSIPCYMYVQTRTTTSWPPRPQARRHTTEIGEMGLHVLNDLELVELVGAGRRLTLVKGLARPLEGLGAVEGCAGPDLGRLLRPQAGKHGLCRLFGLVRRRSPLYTQHTRHVMHARANVPRHNQTCAARRRVDIRTESCTTTSPHPCKLI